MRLAKAFVIVAVSILVAATLPASGCGGKKAPSLSFPSSGETPVVNYSSYKAIAPVYNPDVPVVVIYPNGTIIKKQDSYEFTTGMLSRDQVTSILESLQEKGFFGFKKEYGGGAAKPGGTTENLTVNLESGTYSVSVVGGAGPEGWNDIIDTVINAKVSGVKDYVPSSIILFSKEEPQVPQGAPVTPWPGQASDLAGAAAQDGQKLTGDSAASAWKTVQGAFSKGGAGSEIYWTADGKTYTYVYARPELPGISQ
jgi:hypothetical protein